MKHQDFKIGMQFHCGGHAWKVSDIGTRVIVAVKWKEGWTNGPPFAVDEIVFDEYDMQGCELHSSIGQETGFSTREGEFNSPMQRQVP